MAAKGDVVNKFDLILTPLKDMFSTELCGTTLKRVLKGIIAKYVEKSQQDLY